MDKMTHTVYVWKADRRSKTGLRLVSTTVWKDRDALTVLREVEPLYPKSMGYTVEVVPTMKTVVNLMTGKPVEIAHDTPRACDPSSELYWSM
jgi:hypothetical protein